MATEDVVLRVEVSGEGAARTLEELGQRLQELRGAGCAELPGALGENPVEAPSGRSAGEELLAAVRDVGGLARLIADRLDQQRQVLEGLLEAIAGEEEMV